MKCRKAVRLLALATSALALAGGFLGVAQAQQDHVLFIEVDAIIGPVAEGFIARAVDLAEKDDATLLVIELDTPGGLLDSTRKITQHLLEANVPSAVFVSPRGARAASAGTFITAAATFAVMAPGTNIGAASPVGGGGEDLPETLMSKATNDAAAEMRSIAALRGRNEDKLEATVLQALSFTAEEAVDLGMVDFVANDLDDLLAKLHGRDAVAPPPDGRRVVLDTQGASVRTMEMTLVERFLSFLSDPNVSFLLLSFGGLGIFVELLNPGLIVPGVVGVILLLLAFISFGSLPVNWGGVALILLAVVLGLLEVYVAGFGALGVGAIVSFILGGFLLFFHTGGPSPTMPSVGVSLWVLVSTVLVLGGGGGWVVYTIIRSRREVPELSVSRLVGAAGYVVTELSPRGTVQVESEEWSAISEAGQTVPAGHQIRVTRVDGATLTVVSAVIDAEESGDTQNEYNKGTTPDSGTGG